jgi:hypothetical protein
MVTEAASRTRRGLRTAGVAVAGVVRVVGILLLGTSVVWGWWASWTRFGVCFGGAEPPVGLPEPRRASACEYMQGDLYDQYMPEAPWVPIPDAARLEGLSLMALGVGLAVVSLSLVGRWFVWLLSVAGGVGVGAVWVGMGVPVWRTALAGERVGYEDFMAAISLTWGTFLVTAGLAALSWYWGGRDGKLYAVFWAAMTVAQPLPELFITLMLWPSHDTSPLTGMFRCVLVGFAGLVVLMAFAPLGWRDRWLGRPLRWAGRGIGRVVAKVRDYDDLVSPRQRW